MTSSSHESFDIDTVQWKAESTSLEAHRLVFGDRGADYDHPYIDYSRTVRIFHELSGIDLRPSDGVLFMMAVKLSRLGNARMNEHTRDRFRDHLVDLAGYADCYWAVHTKERPTHGKQETH